MERKFTIFALFYFVFEGKFQVQAPWGAYIRRGNLTEGFLCYDFGGLYLEGLIYGGAYFREFYGILVLAVTNPSVHLLLIIVKTSEPGFHSTKRLVGLNVYPSHY